MRRHVLLAASILFTTAAANAEEKPTFDDRSEAHARWIPIRADGPDKLGTLQLRNVTYLEDYVRFGKKELAVLLRKTVDGSEPSGQNGPDFSLTLDLFTAYREGIKKPEFTATFNGALDATPSASVLRVDYDHAGDDNLDHALISWIGLRPLLRYCTERYVEISGNGTRAWLGFDDTSSKTKQIGALVLVTEKGELSRSAIAGDTWWCPKLEVVPDSEKDGVRTYPDRYELNLASKNRSGTASLTGFSVRATFDDVNGVDLSVSVPVVEGRFEGQKQPETIHLESKARDAGAPLADKPDAG